MTVTNGRSMRDSPDRLARRAARVLRDNDTGALVTAAPKLYPHMWSWDAAFISIGLAHLDVGRAVCELETLFRAQWSDGMLPHILFTDGGSYFPGPERWGTEIASQRPSGVRTSGICQPPVHAIAVRRIVDIARNADAGGDGTSDATRRAEQFAGRLWPALYEWHRWLVRYRMANASGLVAIVHGWESGMDNSPRWDSPYEGVVPGAGLPPYTRLDLLEVADPAERPTDGEYDRYLWLIEEMRRVGYDAAKVVAGSSFLVGDVFTTALFASSCDVLAELGEELFCDTARIVELRRWAERARAAVWRSCHPDTGMARDHDLLCGTWLSTDTIACFAPLLCTGGPGGTSRWEEHLLAVLDGPGWAGHSCLYAAVPPSVSPGAPAFDRRQYWRGPQWPVIAWLFGWAFERRGWSDRYATMREQGIRLTDDGRFGEYYEPFTGEPLGSLNQSWTAAVVLDWLRDGTARVG